MGIGGHRGYSQQEEVDENEDERLQPLEDPEEENQADEEQRQNNSFFFNTQAGFFFGGGRFLSGDDIFMRPEDVAYLQGPLQNMTPPVEKTVTVKSPVNLNKRSLKLLPTDKDGVYNLQFTFDSIVDCVVRVFYLAKETKDKKTQAIAYTSASGTPDGTFFKTGLTQTYTSSTKNQLDISLFPNDEDLDVDEEKKFYPVVVMLEAVTAKSAHVQSQATLAKLYKCADDTLEIKAVKQKIQYRGMSYLVHDIFGIDESRETSEECVICITNPRNTVVIPCRHMCLCHECAEALRHQTNKCPICRGSVRSLLKIEITKPKGLLLNKSTESIIGKKEENIEDDDDEDDDEEEIQLTKKPKKKKGNYETLAVEEPITPSEVLIEA